MTTPRPEALTAEWGPLLEEIIRLVKRAQLVEAALETLAEHRVAIVGFHDFDQTSEDEATSWSLTCSCSNFLVPVDFNNHLRAVLRKALETP